MCVKLRRKLLSNHFFLDIATMFTSNNQQMIWIFISVHFWFLTLVSIIKERIANVFVTSCHPKHLLQQTLVHAFSKQGQKKTRQYRQIPIKFLRLELSIEGRGTYINFLISVYLWPICSGNFIIKEKFDINQICRSQY